MIYDVSWYISDTLNHNIIMIYDVSWYLYDTSHNNTFLIHDISRYLFDTLHNHTFSIHDISWYLSYIWCIMIPFRYKMYHDIVDTLKKSHTYLILYVWMIILQQQSCHWKKKYIDTLTVNNIYLIWIITKKCEFREISNLNLKK